MGSKLVSRRNVLQSAAAVVGGGVALESFLVEPHWLEVTQHDVRVPRLPRLDRTLSGARAPARILLTHSPAFLDRIPHGAGSFALAVAGHTHGGQVRLGTALAPVLPPGSGRFVSGWYELPSGPAYVSRGTGTSLIPARFTCRPELPIYRLRQA